MSRRRSHSIPTPPVLESLTDEFNVALTNLRRSEILKPANPPRLLLGEESCEKCFGDGVVPSSAIWLGAVLMVFCDCWKNRWPSASVYYAIPHSLHPENQRRRDEILAEHKRSQKPAR